MKKPKDDEIAHQTKDEVTACWGEEKISPQQYCTLSVGPFFYKTFRWSNETPEQAFERALRVVNYIGETERARKLREFRRVLKEC